ncbi:MULTISPECIES: AraC family transcriptional regulator [unclassified Spirosoma]|uniref:helix-turn-helix domain-containing protein n=1 Tax=unclassified Spirosoma TaxID=2621999 RepID=UPI00096619DD|nr:MULTISPECIES: AraC family transcriptional regulator [unclassified Spirosoma]MBN8822171.1 helix-turn-helix transcriptional regulator [Spirosoma sp.]OJW80566.1 MAG: AraC family transcriptional regulator [Spirosoma sp. 48-14]
MFYQKYFPAPHLAPFVECYYIWENKPDATTWALPTSKPAVIESPPTGFGSIVFNLGAPYSVGTTQRNSIRVVPTAFMTGQATHQYRLYLPDHIHMLGIVFRPAGIGSLFGLPMVELTDERIALTDVLEQSVHYLAEQLAEAPSHSAQIACLEQFLSFQLIKRNLQPDRIDYVANLIVANRGNVSLSGLIEDAFLCRRQFERKFLQRIGVSPKFYARIRRVSYMCSELASQRWQINDWQDLVYRCGYYDQSHFIKEFTAFTGKNPSLYVRNNLELTQYLSE